MWHILYPASILPGSRIPFLADPLHVKQELVTPHRTQTQDGESIHALVIQLDKGVTLAVMLSEWARRVVQDCFSNSSRIAPLVA